MSAHDDGGGAFPRPHSDCSGGENGCVGSQVGMSLRDYFAAHILAAMVGAAREDGLELRHPKAEAQTAYEFADAMIEERETDRRGPDKWIATKCSTGEDFR